MKYKTLFTVTLCACVSACLLIYPSGVTDGVANGIKICTGIIIPSLFPFTVCALFLYSFRSAYRLPAFLQNIISKVFGLNSTETVMFILSLIGGYPVGAKLIESSYTEGEFTKKEAERLLTFCVNPGPSFVMTAIGTGMLGSTMFGVVLYFSCILSSLTICIISRPFSKADTDHRVVNIKELPISERLVGSVYDATQSLINICAFVVLFAAIEGLIKSLAGTSRVCSGVCALLEITNSIYSGDRNIFIISFLIGFSGVCVHFQILSVCKNLKPNYFKFLLSRISAGLISLFFTFAILKITKIAIPTISAGNATFQISRYSVIFGIALIVCAAVFLTSLRQFIKNR